MLIPSNELLGLPVISMAEGQQLGVVKGLVIDREKICITAMLVAGKGVFKESSLLPFSKIHSIGSHAITIASVTDLERTKSHQVPHITNRSLEGVRVISEKGNAIGVVNDIIVNTETGAIASLEITGRMIEGILKKQAALAVGFIKTMGKDIIVTLKEAEDNLVFSENSIHYKLKAVGDTTIRTLGTTWNKTKEISKNLPLFRNNSTIANNILDVNTSTGNKQTLDQESKEITENRKE